MLKIRFQRTGRRNDPAFRIIVGEHMRHPKSGSHAAILGSYHPKTKEVTLDEGAVKEWMAKGAKPSPTVHNLLISKGVIEGTKINVLPRKKPIVKEEAEKADQPAEDGETPAEAEASDEKAEAPTEEEVTADAETEEAPKEEAAEAEAPAEEAEKKEEAA